MIYSFIYFKSWCSYESAFPRRNPYEEAANTLTIRYKFCYYMTGSRQNGRVGRNQGGEKFDLGIQHSRNIETWGTLCVLPWCHLQHCRSKLVAWSAFMKSQTAIKYTSWTGMSNCSLIVCETSHSKHADTHSKLGNSKQTENANIQEVFSPQRNLNIEITTRGRRSLELTINTQLF